MFRVVSSALGVAKFDLTDRSTDDGSVGLLTHTPSHTITSTTSLTVPAMEVDSDPVMTVFTPSGIEAGMAINIDGPAEGEMGVIPMLDDSNTLVTGVKLNVAPPEEGDDPVAVGLDSNNALVAITTLAPSDIITPVDPQPASGGFVPVFQVNNAEGATPVYQAVLSPLLQANYADELIGVVFTPNVTAAATITINVNVHIFAAVAGNSVVTPPYTIGVPTQLSTTLSATSAAAVAVGDLIFTSDSIPTSGAQRALIPTGGATGTCFFLQGTTLIPAAVRLTTNSPTTVQLTIQLLAAPTAATIDLLPFSLMYIGQEVYSV